MITGTWIVFMVVMVVPPGLCDTKKYWLDSGVEEPDLGAYEM